MNLNALSPSGGIKYHLKALFNKRKWQPFCDFIEAWLFDWGQELTRADVQTLVLIGSNAGYTLPPAFVARFQKIIVVEPDPIAFTLFEIRFSCQAKWIHQDFFDLNSISPKPQKLLELFQAHPKAAFLFCNILGQLPVILRENKKNGIENYMTELAQVLESATQKYILASYHDRYSRNLKYPNEIIDHLTGGLFAGAIDKKECPWRISRHEEHQIEFVKFV